MIKKIREIAFCSECLKKGDETRIGLSLLLGKFLKNEKTVECSKSHQISISHIAPDVTLSHIVILNDSIFVKDRIGFLFLFFIIYF